MYLTISNCQNRISLFGNGSTDVNYSSLNNKNVFILSLDILSPTLNSNHERGHNLVIMAPGSEISTERNKTNGSTPHLHWQLFILMKTSGKTIILFKSAVKSWMCQRIRVWGDFCSSRHKYVNYFRPFLKVIYNRENYEPFDFRTTSRINIYSNLFLSIPNL